MGGQPSSQKVPVKRFREMAICVTQPDRLNHLWALWHCLYLKDLSRFSYVNVCGFTHAFLNTETTLMILSSRFFCCSSTLWGIFSVILKKTFQSLLSLIYSDVRASNSRSHSNISSVIKAFSQVFMTSFWRHYGSWLLASRHTAIQWPLLTSQSPGSPLLNIKQVILYDCPQVHPMSCFCIDLQVEFIRIKA